MAPSLPFRYQFSTRCQFRCTRIHFECYLNQQQQQVAQATSRAVTPTVAPNPQMVLQNQLKQMIEERRYSEAFQRVLALI